MVNQALHMQNTTNILFRAAVKQISQIYIIYYSRK